MEGTGANSTGITKDQFEFGQVLGEGAFGQVRLCKHKTTDIQYAAKILQKENLIKKNQTKYVKTERDILLKLNHDNVLRLYFTFADDKRLYFITELISGGELFVRVRRKKKETTEVIRFYMAELLEAIIYIHENNIVHRDLKPENLLLSGDGHLKLVDFGIAKNIEHDGTHTFCGTVEYLAPEIVQNNKYGKGVDWWAYGCIIYELFCGRSPFFSSSMAITCQKIVDKDIYWPSHIPEDAKDLIDQLLTVDIDKRLGCGESNSPYSADKIRNHKFFEGVKFSELRKTTPPIIPDELGYDGPRGTGLNVSLYDSNSSELNIEEEELLLRSRIIPTSFFNKSECANTLFKGGHLDSIRRSNVIRNLFPELSKLPTRPEPVILDFTDQIAEEQPEEHSTMETVGESPIPPAHRPTIVYQIVFVQTIANINVPVRNVCWSHRSDKVAISGSFVTRYYGLNSSTENIIQVDLLKTEESCSSSSYLVHSPDGTMLAFDMKRKIGITRQRTEKKGSDWSSVQHSTDCLSGHRLPIQCLSWGPDNSTLAAGGLDGIVYIWDVKKQRCIFKINKSLGSINNIEWQSTSGVSSDKLPMIASASSDGRVTIINPNLGLVVSQLDLHNGYSVFKALWSPTDSNLLVSYGADRTLMFIDASNWSYQAFAQPTIVQSAIFSSNGKCLATASLDAIRIWDITTHRVLKVIPRNGAGSAELQTSPTGGASFPLLSFDSTSTRLACTTSNSDRIPVVFDMVSNSFFTSQSSEKHKAPITCMEWSKTKPLLLTGSYDHTVILWGMDEREEEEEDSDPIIILPS